MSTLSEDEKKEALQELRNMTKVPKEKSSGSHWYLDVVRQCTVKKPILAHKKVPQKNNRKPLSIGGRNG